MPITTRPNNIIRRRRTVAAMLAVAAGVALATAAPAVADHGGGDHGDGHHHGHHHGHHVRAFQQTRVVADQAGAPVVDADLVNPWGIAFGPTTPLWTANEATSTSTIYSTNNGPAKAPLTVQTQPSPTGIVYNDTDQFRLPDGSASRFLFDSLSGSLSAWSAPPSTRTVTTATVSGAAFTGLALEHGAYGPRLLAADAASPYVRVFDGAWKQIGTLSDPYLPKGLTPYNVAVLRHRIYVSYATPPGATSSVDGVVDVYSSNGRFQRRLITGGRLDGPWGMVIAPYGWGRFSGRLLVGNEDGGAINAFDAYSGRFVGTLRNRYGHAIGGDGLWGMAFGNGVFGRPDQLIIAIGTDGYKRGEVDLVTPVRRTRY